MLLYVYMYNIHIYIYYLYGKWLLYIIQIKLIHKSWIQLIVQWARLYINVLYKVITFFNDIARVLNSEFGYTLDPTLEISSIRNCQDAYSYGACRTVYWDDWKASGRVLRAVPGGFTLFFPGVLEEIFD